MGQTRVELVTPALSERCSNQLSYCPELSFDRKKKERKIQESPRPVRTHALVFFPLLLEKEVIQPHLPVRLPCYDFTPLTRRTFDSVLLAVRLPASGTPHSDGVTGGVYKARERIHRAVLMCDY